MDPLKNRKECPSNYDPYGRRPRRGPQGEPSQVLTASQIAKIEAAFEELQKKAAHWETQAKQWQATAAESQAVAGEWKERVKIIGERAGRIASAGRRSARKLQPAGRNPPDDAQDNFAAWEAKAARVRIRSRTWPNSASANWKPPCLAARGRPRRRGRTAEENRSRFPGQQKTAGTPFRHPGRSPAQRRPARPAARAGQSRSGAGPSAWPTVAQAQQNCDRASS